MNTYVFELQGIDGRNYQMEFDDSVFDYFAVRYFLYENDCLEIINEIKVRSGKKIAITYGNCQTKLLRAFLLNNQIFSEQYFLIKIPAVCEYGNDDAVRLRFLENFWSLCDLFISQRVKKDNRHSPILATQGILSRLPESAKIIWIPGIHFNGYFPQHKKNLRNVDTDKQENGRFPAGDKYIDAFLDGGGQHTISELVEYIERQDFISSAEVLKFVEKAFEEHRKHEWACDIHMFDFLFANYRRQLTYSPNHPTTNCIMELSRRVLNFMDITDTVFQNTRFLMSENNSLVGIDVPIYPKVKEILGMEYSLDVFYPNRYFPSEYGKFRPNYIEYLVEYAKTCWSDKLILE